MYLDIDKLDIALRKSNLTKTEPKKRDDMNSIFETEITIRPDDIDLNNHVHNANYLDFVQAARYDQMKNVYKMPMENFYKLGYSWFASIANIE